jgi:predicted phage terminase large subunit-like protein
MGALKLEIGPQPGPQTEFLSTLADIAIYGGAAGGGKSFALLLEPLRHWDNAKFGGVIFRRNTVQVRNEGGLWDESFQLYKQLGAHPRESVLEWEMPSGARLKFAHLEYDKTVYDWQGSQIAFIGFDELTHFSEKQFWYMLSRNRSSFGVPGYIRATTNPDADSWVRKLIDWYIDSEGYPIPERSGVLRWFIRQDEQFIWGDSKEEIEEQYGVTAMPKSFTFVPSKLQDNKILMEKDPTYLANLRALSRVDRLRLEYGNWNVRNSAGMFFQKNWFEVIGAIPSGWSSIIRYWDRAATKPNEANKDPDWTRGIKLYKYPDGTWCVADMRSSRDTPLQIENLIRNTASHDGPTVEIGIEQDPGSSGVADADNYVRLLQGYIVHVCRPDSDKITRAKPVSAQCERGNVKILRAPWNDDFFAELENFGEENSGHDDQVDVLSGAFNKLCDGQASILDVL